MKTKRKLAFKGKRTVHVVQFTFPSQYFLSLSPFMDWPRKVYAGREHVSGERVKINHLPRTYVPVRLA